MRKDGTMGKGAKHHDNATREGHRRGHELPVERIVERAVYESRNRPGRRPRTVRQELLERLTNRHEGAATVLARQLLAAVGEAWQRHWQPAELRRALEHSCGTKHARLGAEAVLRQLQTYRPGPLPPRWQAQMDAMDPGTDALGFGDRAMGLCWAAPAHPGVGQRSHALAVAVETVAYLQSVPRLPKIGPLPGEPVHSSAYDSAHVDPSVLHRVSSLLAKAESTTFPQEAEALTAKAQELMARHAIDMALIEAQRGDTPTTPAISARRVGIDDPYAKPKAILVSVIAQANRCRCVWDADLAFCTVFGDEGDLDTVELLYASLLIQSTRAMIAASPPARASGGQTRSFRQSFLVSFAYRIGDRLSEAVASAVDAAGDDQARNLLPVLASREAAADAACREAFPQTRKTRTAANSIEGWQAGQRAADRAQLNLHDTVGPSTGNGGSAGKVDAMALRPRGA